MRVIAFACLVWPLSLAALSGCIDRDQVRIQSFTRGAYGSFTYGSHTNTVMTPNDDGGAEQIRRDWLAQTLGTQGMCNGGYVIDQRRLLIAPQRPAFDRPQSSPPPVADADADLAFGNGGEVVYAGRCL